MVFTDNQSHGKIVYVCLEKKCVCVCEREKKKEKEKKREREKLNRKLSGPQRDLFF
jgi:hypothetical protein